jgi:hypothetical protein
MSVLLLIDVIDDAYALPFMVHPLSLALPVERESMI